MKFYLLDPVHLYGTVQGELYLTILHIAHSIISVHYWYDMLLMSWA
jgi:hypothetical protein